MPRHAGARAAGERLQPQAAEPSDFAPDFAADLVAVLVVPELPDSGAAAEVEPSDEVEEEPLDELPDSAGVEETIAESAPRRESLSDPVRVLLSGPRRESLRESFR